MSDTLVRSPQRVAHDALLASQPAEAAHDAASCEHCIAGVAESTASKETTPMELNAEQLQAQIDAAVQKATTDTEARVRAEMEAANAEAGKDAKIADLEAQINTVTTERDTARAEALTHKTALEDAAKAKEEADEAEAKNAQMRTKGQERIDEIKAAEVAAEVTLMTDEQYAANLTTWGEMTDEQWAAQAKYHTDIIASVADVVKASGTGTTDPLAERTGAFQASAGAGNVGSGKNTAALDAFNDLARKRGAAGMAALATSPIPPA